MKIEAEGGELILKNKAGDHVIIPKKYRLEVQDMIKEKCYKCIDSLVDKLPVMEDYALNGTLLPSFTNPEYMKGAPETIDEGYKNIDSYYNNDTPENRQAVTGIQKMLIKQKYLQPNQKSGNTSADGIFGDGTKNAYEQYVRNKANSRNSTALEDATPTQEDTSPKRTPYPFNEKQKANFSKIKASKPAEKKGPINFNSEEEYMDYSLGKQEGYVAASESSHVDTSDKELYLESDQLKEKLENPQVKVESKSLIDPYEKKEIEKIKTEGEARLKKYYGDFSGKNSEEVKAIQQDLVDKGYDLGTFGDGHGVDGKFGDATLVAYSKEMEKNLGKYEQKDLSGELKKKNCDSEWGCAAYVSHATDFAALGDAWTMLGKLKKQNKNVKFNIYDDAKFKNVNSSNLISTTKLVKKNLKADKEMFSMGDAVGLFLPGSHNNQKALKEGDKTYNSHVGLVTGFQPDGTPIVTHNIYGKLHHDAYNTLNIAWIAETGARESVKYDDKTNVDKAGKEPTSATENVKYYSENMTKDMSTGTIDAEQVANDVYGILGTESKFGKLAPTEEDLASTQFKRKAYGLVDKDVKSNRSNISTGSAKIKLATLSNKEQQFLGVNSANDLKSMKNSVKVATYLYIKRHNYFDEYAKKNPQLNLTPQDVQALTILSHNQGDSGLKNFGYNKKGAYFSESVKALRDLQEGKVKDITSTKYKYFNLIPGAGDMLYDASLIKSGDKYGKDPYIKKVNYHGAKLPEVKKEMAKGKTEEEAKEIVTKRFYKEKLKKDKQWEKSKWIDQNKDKLDQKYGTGREIES